MRNRLAIVGMACRVPGARNYRSLWTNVESGSTGMVDVTEEDRVREGIRLDPTLRNLYVPVAAPLDGFDEFDHAAFGLGPGEAQAMNVNHRVMMEVALEALEDAGCDPLRFDGRMGLFAAGGAASPRFVAERSGDRGYGDWSRPLRVSEALNWAAILDNDFLTTRIAYALDLRGPCLTVQTACSSSLVALHLACQSVLSGEADAAIAGGVNIEIPHRVGYYYQDGGIWSDDGACRPFDRAANGTIAGSGAGAVVVKPLRDAVAAGDAIHAVICGSAVNNDGNRKVGFTAPSVKQQSQVIRDALAAAGSDGSDVGYLEAHGTGTAVGDLVEWAGIERALGTEGVPCGIGATKANVGHLGSAAGIVGLIKAALVVKSGRIPPVANFNELNPQISRRNERLFIPDRCTPWDGDGMPRRVGVSSMGIGGTNAHVVLEQAPLSLAADEADDCVVILPVSAATAGSVDDAATSVTEFAHANPQRLTGLARTMSTGRRTLAHREAIVVARRSGSLSAWRTERREAKPEPTTALVFPGQGGNVGDLIAARREIDGFDDLLTDALKELVAPDRQVVTLLLAGAVDIERTPLQIELAVLVQAVAIARSLISAGLEAPVLCGFSLGELTAGVVGNVFTLREAVAVLTERARILTDAAPGAMIRVRAPEATVRSWLGRGVSLAIVPSPADCMLSGEADAIGALAERLRSDGVRCAPVPVPHPFHSDLLGDFVNEYTDVWAQVDLRPPSLRIMSPIAGGWLDDDTAVAPDFWAKHLVRPVRFGEALSLLRADDADLALVLDSERGVTSFVKSAFGTDTVAMAADEHPGFDALARARLLASAWAVGHDRIVDSPVRPDHDDPPSAGIVHGPTYAFDRSSTAGRPSALMVPTTSPADSRIEDVTPLRPGATTMDDQIRRVVAQVVGCPVDEIGSGSSFLELGYDSFLLIQLADALSEQFRTDVDVQLLYFELDTCEALHEHLRSIGAPPTAAPSGIEHQQPRPPESDPSVITAAPPVPRTAPASSRPRSSTPREDATVALSIELEWERRTPLSKRITEEDRFALADQRNLVTIRRGRRDVSYPVVGAHGEGARFTDVDGREYLDLCMGFGVLLLGHASEPLTTALDAFAPRDLLIGPQSSTAGEVARGVAALTGVDRVAFASSGTEAVMGAVRAARATTGRDVIALFSGSYHGTFDGVLAAQRAGGEAGETTPLGRGTPSSIIQDVVMVPYSDEAIPILEAYGDRLAAVLVEPVQSRRPGHQPIDLLHQLRDLTSAHGTALVFDEIITGFRCHSGGAAALFGVRPDLVTYGKVLGGGLPIGVIGGDADFMAPIDGGRWREGEVGFPQRPSMVFAGTFSKHPLSMAVAQHMISHLKRESPELQASLTQRTADLAHRINALAETNGFPIEVEQFSSVFRINVNGSSLSEDMFFLAMLNRGVYVWEGRTCFLSSAHTDVDCAEIADVVFEAASEVARSGLWDVNAEPRRMSTAPPPATTTAEAPLTDGQKLLWMACELGGDRGESYTISDAVEVDLTLDAEQLRRAIARVSERHEAMRLGFDGDGGSQASTVDVVPQLTVTDMSGKSRSDVAAMLQQLDRGPLDMSSPSLFEFHLVLTGERSFVQVTAPHCVVDGWSVEVMWSELSEFYLARNIEPNLPAPVGFLDYVRWKRTDEDARFAENDARWMEPLEAAWQSLPPVAEAGPWAPTTRVDALSPHGLALMGELARSSGCTMHNASLAVVTVASSLLTGASRCVTLAHQAGQPRFSHRPLIGFCVDLLPVMLELTDDATAVELAVDVQAQVLARSNHTSGIYRTLQSQQLRRVPAAIRTFNYDRFDTGGLFGAATTPLAVPRRMIPSPTILTIEEHRGGLQLISEIADVSDLAPYGDALASTVEMLLDAPDRPLGELRRHTRT